MLFQNILTDMEKSNVALAKRCHANPDLHAFCQSGLGAMKREHRKYINVPDTQLIGCTVDLDKATEKAYPSANRWDYALEYEGNMFFIEIHPAVTSEIACMIQKVDFVTEWLKNNAPEVLELPKKEVGPRQFYWVSSGRTDLRLSPNSPQRKKLILKHIKSVGCEWNYAKLFFSK